MSGRLVRGSDVHDRNRRSRSPESLFILAGIRNWSRGELLIEDGSLYPALNRMLVKGWLKAEWGISENNRRARFYRLTPEGRKQLERESNAFNKMVRAIQLVMCANQEAP